MSTTRHTTRHHLNRQRRLAAVTAQTTATEQQSATAQRTPTAQQPATEQPTTQAGRPGRKPRGAGAPTDGTGAGTLPEEATGSTAPDTIGADSAAPRSRGARRRALPRGIAVLCLLTLLCGAFAGWAASRADELRGTAAARNTALTDAARTSEVKGQAEKAVNALFSYDHAAPGAMDEAEARWLTGKAVAQHKTLLAPVLATAGKQKTVVTTTVTDTAVERIEGDRARVLVFADQSSTSTAAKATAAANYAGAMLAVDLVRSGGNWRVSGLDTFGD
jgi:Mce-associated membrane protein